MVIFRIGKWLDFLLPATELSVVSGVTLSCGEAPARYACARSEKIIIH